VKVGEVLLAGVVEVDVGVSAPWSRSGNPDDWVRRSLLSHYPEGLPSVHRTEPGAALGPGSGRTADKDPALRVDGDIGFAVAMHRVDHGRDPKRDRSRSGGDRRGGADGRLRCETGRAQERQGCEQSEML